MIRQLLAEGRGSRLFREVREREGLASEIDLLGETGPRQRQDDPRRHYHWGN